MEDSRSPPLPTPFLPRLAKTPWSWFGLQFEGRDALIMTSHKRGWEGEGRERERARQNTLTQVLLLANYFFKSAVKTLWTPRTFILLLLFHWYVSFCPLIFLLCLSEYCLQLLLIFFPFLFCLHLYLSINLSVLLSLFLAWYLSVGFKHLVLTEYPSSIDWIWF